MSKFKLLDVCLGLMETQGEAFSTGVTLFIRGVTVSGELIHPVSYLKGMADLLEAQTSGEDQERPNIADIFGKSLREFIDFNIEKHKTENNEVDKEPEVVYLKDITLWNPPKNFQIGGSFLALNIESIDGFVWGKMSNND